MSICLYAFKNIHFNNSLTGSRKGFIATSNGRREAKVTSVSSCQRRDNEREVHSSHSTAGGKRQTEDRHSHFPTPIGNMSS